MIRRLLVGGLTKLVRGYQLVVSPWFAPTCRYYPSCSQYAIDALTTHGPLRGTGLAVWRLLRCNPWSAGGVDHVPAKDPSGSSSHVPPVTDPGPNPPHHSHAHDRAAVQPARRSLHGIL